MNDDAKPGEGGSGHPLPDSDEAREDLIPEHLIREKGHGEDARASNQPQSDLVAPDGESYEIQRDQEAHQDQGQSYIDDPDR